LICKQEAVNISIHYPAVNYIYCYTVSQKTSKIIFVITTSTATKSDDFCQKDGKFLKLYKVYSFSTSSNSCQCTTVLIADVPNCHITR